MTEPGEMRRPVTKAVLIVAAASIAMIAAWTILVFAFDITPPNSAGSLTGLVSTIAGAAWFGQRLERPMSSGERLGFATGVLLVNVLIPIIFVVGALAWLGVPISLAGIDLVFGGGRGYLLEPALLWLLVFILGLTFAQAYLFGWLLTRKRGKVRATD